MRYVIAATMSFFFIVAIATAVHIIAWDYSIFFKVLAAFNAVMFCMMAKEAWQWAWSRKTTL